jgi:8-amino-7-oxononanoate synthase
MPSDNTLRNYALARGRLAGRALIDAANAPWFLPLDRLQEEAAKRGGKLISFANYDYLGIADHPSIKAAAHAALDKIGVGALGSRLVGGERRIHAAFEEKLAKFIGTERCLTLVSGYLTNLSTISSIMGRLDLIVYDELSHNSIVAGVMACRTDHKTFRHNDMDDLRAILKESRGKYRNCLIAAESLYSMDGDIVDLPALLRLKEEFGCWLILDEAHSIGVLGKTGRGICEHFGEDPRRIDVIVGTLSKTFASCGGFLCVSAPVLDLMRYTLPGFVYSVGLPPVIAAAAQGALDILIAEPQRVTKLRENGRHFLAAAKAAGLSTGAATGDAIVPLHFPEVKWTMEASAWLLERGIYAPPIVSMGVPKDLPRIRFFVSAKHSTAEIDFTVSALRDFLAANPSARVGVTADAR